MSEDTTPRFSPRDAQALLERHFALEGTLAPLPSERDQNFSLRTASGEKYALKIAKAGERREILDLQNAMIAHLRATLEGLDFPALKRTESGEEIAEATDERGRAHWVRLISWVEGIPWVHAVPHVPALLDSLGQALARIDGSLQSFSHPAMHRDLHWDLKHADQAFRHAKLLSADERALIGGAVEDWHRIDWPRLRTGVIHGDANDYNVLVRGGRVVSLLDVGDTVHSAVVCDLAIALAYVMLDKPDPIAAARAVASAYHRTFPLTPAEADAIYPLAASRLCMSVCYAALNAREKGGDDYQQVTAAPAWKLLAHLKSLPAGWARAELRAACAGP